MAHTPSSSAIGRTLGSLRERCGVPLAVVSRAAGVPRYDLREIEGGRQRPSVAVLARIAGTLGTTLLAVIRSADSQPTSEQRLVKIEDIARAIVDLPPSLGSKLDAVLGATVLHAMDVADNNQSGAARLLGVDRKAFIRRLANAKHERPARKRGG